MPSTLSNLLILYSKNLSSESTKLRYNFTSIKPNIHQNSQISYKKPQSTLLPEKRITQNFGSLTNILNYISSTKITNQKDPLFIESNMNTSDNQRVSKKYVASLHDNDEDDVRQEIFFGNKEGDIILNMMIGIRKSIKKL